jgi:hypothetical protein
MDAGCGSVVYVCSVGVMYTHGRNKELIEVKNDGMGWDGPISKVRHGEMGPVGTGNERTTQ